jgi:hypothetical protein
MSDHAGMAGGSETSSSETRGAVTCAWCGAVAADVPVTWTVQSSDRGLEYLCETCTRTNVRQIESQLPTEWW